MNEPRFVKIGGIRIVAADRCHAARIMVDAWHLNSASGYQSPPKLSFSANGQVLALYGRDPSYRALIDQADVVDADGMPLVLMSRLLLKNPLPERIATTDFVHDLSRLAATEGMSFYLLGGREEVNKQACEFLKRRYPLLKVVGRHHGYFDEGQEASVIDAIQAAKPDVLWVGLGTPRQEQFCIRHRAKLKGVTWIKTCGGLFDFISGSASRAPVWMQRAGLEWVYRMMREPGRLGWRYLTTNPYALWRMLLYTRDVDQTH